MNTLDLPTPLLDEHEALLQFVYLAPVGLAQARMDGEILMANPLCAQLLMPLALEGALDNLYGALQPLLPDLAQRVASFPGDHGKVCDAMQLTLAGTDAPGGNTVVLSLTLLKLDSTRLMAVLSDVTQAVLRDRALQQRRAWIESLVGSTGDYALVPLDAEGCVSGWSASLQRLTGHGLGTVEGRPLSIFHPDGACSAARLAERLQAADRHGWSLDEGWRRRADGSHFWGSCLIAPLHAPGDAPTAQRAYSLILRDISGQPDAQEALRRSPPGTGSARPGQPI